MTLNSGTVTLTNARVPAAAMGRIGDGSLHTVDISGRNELRVPTPGFASDPAWSPLLS